MFVQRNLLPLPSPGMSGLDIINVAHRPPRTSILPKFELTPKAVKRDDAVSDA